jgi:hypothetical protein
MKITGTIHLGATREGSTLKMSNLALFRIPFLTNFNPNLLKACVTPRGTLLICEVHKSSARGRESGRMTSDIWFANDGG